jgi:hypothetical protein
MPVFDFVQWDKVTGGTLTLDGPIIPVEVSMPEALESWCIKHNFPVPAAIAGYALIDTGAAISGIHEPILEQLSVVPIDSISLVTPSSTSKAFVYPTRVAFPALNVQGYSLSRVVGSQLNWKTSDGKEVIMLLGRDILQHFLLIYNGKMCSITLAY